MASTSVAFGLGAYFGNPGDSDWTSNYAKFTQIMGARPTYYDGYTDFTIDPSQWAANAGWLASEWASSGANYVGPTSGTTPVIGLPLASNAGGWSNVDTFYKQIIAGKYDGDYKGVIDKWAQAGYKTVQFRLDYEFNGNWMAWSPGNSGSPTAAADYIAAFQHVANLVHSEGKADGITAQVVWNPSAMNWAQPAGQSTESLYPGDQYVDIISIDQYSQTWPLDYTNWSAPDASGKPVGTASSATAWAASATNREHYWNYPGANQYNPTPSGGSQFSLLDTISMAEQHHKPLSLSETGAGNASNGPQGPIDDGAFPQWEAQVLANAINHGGLQVSNADIWASNAGGTFNFMDGSKPQEAAAWAKYFGSGSAQVDGLTSGGTGGGSVITIPDSQTNATINQSNVTIQATGGHHALFLGGTGDTVNITGANEKIVDSGSSNTIVLQAAGTYYDGLFGNVLGNGDTLDLRSAMAATSWDHNSADVGNYLAIGTDAGGEATLRLRDSASGMRSTIAVLHNYTSASTSLSDVLAHSILS